MRSSLVAIGALFIGSTAHAQEIVLISPHSVATESQLGGDPERRDVLDEQGNPVDLSPFTPEQRHARVAEYFGAGNEVEAARRHTLRRLKSGEISQEQYTREIHEGISHCEFGPAQTPNGFTIERLRQLQASAVSDVALWQQIMSEPPRGDSPGPRIALQSPLGPNCIKSRYGLALGAAKELADQAEALRAVRGER